MSTSKRIVIVGGVAGGASAAARARRLSEDASIVLLERGAEISFANCGMPYHIAGVIPQRQRLLVQTAAGMSRRYRIDVRTGCQALRIDRRARQVIVRELATGRQYAEPYDALILSPGAQPIRRDIPGGDDARVFVLRSLADMDAIKARIDQSHAARALVLGGGYIGLEMVEAMRHRGLAVTLVELAPQVMSAVDPEMAVPVHHELRRNGVDLRLGTTINRIEPRGDSLAAHLSTGHAVECDMIVLAAGVQPENHLAAQAGLAIGPTGGVVVDEHMRTSDPDIFAVGDVVEVEDHVGQFKAHIPLAGPANRQGRIAADNALGRPTAYKRTQGTAIVKVFDLAVAMTGLSERAIKRRGLPYEKIYVHPASHAGYYPGATPISIKLLFDPSGGKVLGAQALGRRGVDKRIDVLAVTIRAGMTVFDLENLELCYAPPFGSAKDPVNYAGFVAANVLRGDVRICHSDELASPRDDQFLLDVRTEEEVLAGTIPGAANVPLDELRDRLGELPRDKELLVFCQVGLRGYLACRILHQHGFACRNLTGGYKTYQAAAEAISRPPAEPTEPAEMTDDTGAESLPAAQPRTDKEDNKMGPFEVTVHVDATGLACPGPIMRLKQELEKLQPGQALSITAGDAGFLPDVRAWCSGTGNTLVSAASEGGRFVAVVAKTAGQPGAAQASLPGEPQAKGDGKTIVVFSGDLDKAIASFIIASGAAAMGSPVTMFFTFWGLNVLRRDRRVGVRKTLIERILAWMMPRGPRRLKLSKMHMGGMGTRMIKGIMRKHGVPSLEELIAGARAAGVRLVACRMSMDLMGFKEQELIDGVEYGGVATYLDSAQRGNVNLFV